MRLACAESFTGGGLAVVLTSIPGSSVWFEQGWVTYSNESKMDCLGVPLRLIEQQGVVSEVVVNAMAAGVLRHSGADIAVATTGVAGPGDGGTGLSVGQGWISVQRRGLAPWSYHGQWSGDRSAVRQQAIDAACDFLCRIIVDHF